MKPDCKWNMKYESSIYKAPKNQQLINKRLDQAKWEKDLKSEIFKCKTSILTNQSQGND